MLLKKLKKILPHDGDKYPEDFQKIIQNLFPTPAQNEEITDFLFFTFINWSERYFVMGPILGG